MWPYRLKAFVATNGCGNCCCIYTRVLKASIKPDLHLWKTKCEGMGLQLIYRVIYILRFSDDQIVADSETVLCTAIVATKIKEE